MEKKIQGMPGSVDNVSRETLTQKRKELDELLANLHIKEPIRSGIDDPNIEWRHGKPNYTLANLSYLKGRTITHKPGSLEEIVQNLVKVTTWEMEASHKVNVCQWTTVDHDSFRVQANGGKAFNLKEASAMGNYNALMQDVDKSLYDCTKHTFQSSHDLFINTFDGTFPWEVLKVFSGPPLVAFSWRHWGTFKGEYKNRKGDGKVYEMQGFAVVKVNDQLKIQDLKIFYDPESFLKALEGKLTPEAISNGKQLLGQVSAK